MAHAEPAFFSAADQLQLKQWLGEEAVSLTNIYTKQAGHTAADFHAATDGQGRTLFVVEATNRAGETWLVGGYNPQSWSSSGSYNVTSGDSERTAFLFNLSERRIHRQMLNGYGVELVGAYQTYNSRDSGPSFGWGHDLHMSADLNTGYSLLYSYAQSSLGDMNLSMIDGAPFGSPSDVRFGRMQVFTISAVPEPSGTALLTVGLAALAVAARRRSRR